MSMCSSILKFLTRSGEINNFNVIKRNFASFLYVPRAQSNSKVTTVLPPQIKYLLRQDDIPKIKESLESRQLSDDDVDVLFSQCQQVSQLTAEMKRLETLKQETASNTANKINLKAAKEEIEQLIQTGRQLKTEIKSVSNRLQKIEEWLVPKLLTLPNILHPQVPLNTDKTLKISNVKPPVFEFPVKSHLEIGSNLNCIKFSQVNPGAYYLLGRMAALELAVLDYFAQQFGANGFIRFANPDICKSVIVEGCGTDINDPLNSFQLDDDQLEGEISRIHLTGSASLPAFCAFYAKHVVRSADLPIKHFASGRFYRPNNSVPITEEEDSLFNVKQSSQLYFFNVTTSTTTTNRGSCTDEDDEESLETLLKCFDDLEVHYRVVDVCAPKLLACESRRIEIQMWSPHLKTYKTVSSLSHYENYIAKRLWMCYIEKKKFGFTRLIGGNAVTIPPFLACLIENLQTQNADFQIPNVLRSCITTFY